MKLVKNSATDLISTALFCMTYSLSLEEINKLRLLLWVSNNCYFAAVKISKNSLADIFSVGSAILR